MSRQRLKPGEWGKITTTNRNGTDVAKVRVRDRDGVLRLVEATGTSAEDARLNVQKKLTDRVTPTGARAALSARSPMTDLAAYWLEEKEGTVEIQTLGLYTDTWDRVCRPALGSLQVGEVTTGTVDAFLRTIAKKAPSRARLAQIVCSGIFSTAVRLDLIPYNPARETTRPKIKKKPVRAITVEEFEIRPSEDRGLLPTRGGGHRRHHAAAPRTQAWARSAGHHGSAHCDRWAHQ